MLVTCFSTARSVTKSRSAIAGVRAALRHQLEHLALARRQLVERVVARGGGRRAVRRPSGSSAEPPSATRRTAPRNSSTSDDAVLEQVADALGAVREQVERVAGLDVLREHEHAGLRVLLADLLARRAGPRRCASAACGCRRSRRRACTSAPSASAPRRCRPGRRPRSRRPRAAARCPREGGRSPRRARRAAAARSPRPAHLEPRPREVKRETRRDELVEPLGLVDPGQRVDAEVARLRLGAQRCRARLPRAAPGRRDPRCRSARRGGRRSRRSAPSTLAARRCGGPCARAPRRPRPALGGERALRGAAARTAAPASANAAKNSSPRQSTSVPPAAAIAPRISSRCRASTPG